jgi:hypothetical protein
LKEVIMVTIQFDSNDGLSPILTTRVHRYNVVDELARIHRWGGTVVRIIAD